MDSALLTIAAGLRAQTESLDLLGNNLANSATTGYKADNEFYRLFMTPEAASAPGNGEALWMPVVEGSLIDYQQGFMNRDDNRSHNLRPVFHVGLADRPAADVRVRFPSGVVRELRGVKAGQEVELREVEP